VPDALLGAKALTAALWEEEEGTGTGRTQKMMSE